MAHNILSLLFIIFLTNPAILGQNITHRSLGPYTMLEEIVYKEKQEKLLTYIADDCTEGRETGTNASQMVAKFISDKFKEYGLEPYNRQSFFQPFMADSSTRARNVAGIVKSTIPSEKYVIIAAHYDHIGKINGKIYNGADNNASGVTVLLNLADMFGTMKKVKLGPDKNIILVALDGKEYNKAGSKFFVKHLNIDKKKIICVINIDQIGTILEPVIDNDTNFVMVLGEKTLKREYRGKIKMCNNFYKTGLYINYTFYGSDTFTEFFYKMSDSEIFHEAGIPSLLFTSGFHKYTYKTTDDPEIISYPVMKKRTILIFYFTITL